MQVFDLVVGMVCGGFDGISGIFGNFVVGCVFDWLVVEGVVCIFEEIGEFIGCEYIMVEWVVILELGEELKVVVDKVVCYYVVFGFGSFVVGNVIGGLLIIEEKLFGVYVKFGNVLISCIIKLGDELFLGGLFLMDVVFDGDVWFGFLNILDNVEIVEMIVSGVYFMLFIIG